MTNPPWARPTALLFAAAILGCASSSPHTAAAAAAWTGVAGVFSVAQRGLGGCYSTCTNGTACNPKTGFCEKSDADCACPAGEVCLRGPGGIPKCVPPAMSIFSEQTQAEGPFLVTPETGHVPTLPVVPTPVVPRR